MPGIPWQSLSPFDSSRTYLALLTHLPLRSYWRIPQFLGFTAQLRRQLTGSNGVIGYAMLAWPVRKEFWTLSVWEDEDALMAFVHHPLHTRVMQALIGHLGTTKFVRWAMKGSGVPPTWQDAFTRFRAG